MPVPTDNTVYIDFILSKSTSEDDKGYIIEAEVSNEGLDQQEQIVLQRALLDSKDYFLRNGVISFDHLHGQKQDPRYIIGEPIDVYTKGTSTFVRGRLFRNNEFAEDIVNKLKNNAKVIRSSVGGLKPVIVNEYDAKLKRPVEKVVSVLWNDWAVTAKPVLDNLSPVRLVKSLMAGYVTDSATATGGGALGVQDLEGADRKKKAIHAVITAIAVGDVKTPEDGLSVLADNGVESKEASDILEEVVNRRRKLQEVFRMDANLTKSFDQAIEELEKAMKGQPSMPPAPMPAPAPHAEPGEDNAGGPSDGDEDNEEEEEDEDEDEKEAPPAPPAPPMPPMKKSADEEDYEFLDVSPILSSMAKSLKALKADNKALAETVKAQGDLLKSLGNVQIQSAQVLKSLSDQPVMRKSVINKQERFATAPDGSKVEMTPNEILRKSTVALDQGKISLRQATIIEDRVNKGMDIDGETLSMLKSL